MTLHPATRGALAAAAALLCAACTTQPDLSEGRQLIAMGRYEEGLASLEQAARTHPKQLEAYTVYVMQRDAIVSAHVREGDSLRQAGNFDAAEAQYRRALRLDPASAVVQSGLEANAKARRHAELMAQAEQALRNGDAAGAERTARTVLAADSTHPRARAVMKAVNDRRGSAEAVPPRLRAALQRPVTLDLRDAPLRSILGIMASHGDLNFVFDRDVKTDMRTSIMVRDMSLDDVLRVLLLTNQLERKTLNDNSILIYPATQAKQREYQELVTRSFYLSNADPKQTAAMIRALVKTRDLFVDEKLNLIIMRDTADAVRLAEQLVATQDLGEPEVMLELEVLEVASSLAQELGLRYPEQVGFYLPDASGAIPALVELSSRNLQAMVANPVLLLNLRKQDGTTNLLANPRIRVKNRDKAKVHIGERVPVITTTSTANVGVSSSVSYLETGLKLDVEPNIFLDDEVAIKIQLEVSNILEQLNVSGTVAYRLGTRNAATTLRLRDGETQVLAGLISSEDRKNFAKVPYAGDMPVLGRLFRNDNIQGSKSEIVLLLTPRIVRNLARPDTVAAQFFSGTDAAPGAPPLRLTSGGRVGISPDATAAPAVAAAPAAGPATAPAGAPVPLNVIAPAQAPVGSEFTVSLSLSSANAPVNASIQLAYDPTVLNVVGTTPAPTGAAPAPDRGGLTVDVAAAGIPGTPATPTQVRFKVVATAPTNTEIGMEVVTSSRPVATPPAAQPLSIVGR